MPIDPIPSHRQAQGLLPLEESEADRSLREPWGSAALREESKEHHRKIWEHVGKYGTILCQWSGTSWDLMGLEGYKSMEAFMGKSTMNRGWYIAIFDCRSVIV